MKKGLIAASLVLLVSTMSYAWTWLEEIIVPEGMTLKISRDTDWKAGETDNVIRNPVGGGNLVSGKYINKLLGAGTYRTDNFLVPWQDKGAVELVTYGGTGGVNVYSLQEQNDKLKITRWVSGEHHLPDMDTGKIGLSVNPDGTIVFYPYKG